MAALAAVSGAPSTTADAGGPLLAELCDMGFDAPSARHALAVPQPRQHELAVRAGAGSRDGGRQLDLAVLVRGQPQRAVRARCLPRRWRED